jgi:hypothetical protein
MEPTHEKIARLAYQLWEERGRPNGSPEIDWKRAEVALQIETARLLQTPPERNEVMVESRLAEKESQATAGSVPVRKRRTSKNSARKNSRTQ